MTLANTLRQKLSEWRPAGQGRHTLAVTDESGWTAVLTADRQDQIGCVLWEVTLRRPDATSNDPLPALRAWADRTAKNVKGLLERLRVVEVDATRREALLRSDVPAERDDSVAYYEILLKGSSQAIVQRYQGSTTGQRRTQIPFTLTHEVVAQLAEDIALAP